MTDWYPLALAVAATDPTCALPGPKMVTGRLDHEPHVPEVRVRWKMRKSSNRGTKMSRRVDDMKVTAGAAGASRGEGGDDM